MGTMCFRIKEEELKEPTTLNFFDLKADDITGRRIDFYIYKNRSLFLLVNFATKSPLAKLNFQMLNELHAQYRDHGLEIMAFPCDQFGAPESKNGEALLSQVRENFDVKFSLFQKVEVNGSGTHSVYMYLRKQPLLMNPETGMSKLIPSDFTICLLNKEGKLFRCFKGSKDFEELKKSLKRTLTHERLATKKLIASKDIK